jgi:hypothetical protein
MIRKLVSIWKHSLSRVVIVKDTFFACSTQAQDALHTSIFWIFTWRKQEYLCSIALFPSLIMHANVASRARLILRVLLANGFGCLPVNFAICSLLANSTMALSYKQKK